VPISPKKRPMIQTGDACGWGETTIFPPVMESPLGDNGGFINSQGIFDRSLKSYQP